MFKLVAEPFTHAISFVKVMSARLGNSYDSQVVEAKLFSIPKAVRCSALGKLSCFLYHFSLCKSTLTETALYVNVFGASYCLE